MPRERYEIPRLESFKYDVSTSVISNSPRALGFTDSARIAALESRKYKPVIANFDLGSFGFSTIASGTPESLISITP
jgi:hypothetical protein